MTMADKTKREPVPRGLARTGPVILSYGFRPFFLGAGIWSATAMALWIIEVSFGIGLGGSLGGSAWHAHEMLFGYSSAALAGFLLTAIPNWTGRLPVSGKPLLGLVSLWAAGRLVLLWPALVGELTAVAIDAAFLPVLFLICAREIVAGRKWKDLKVLAALLALASANGYFHYANFVLGDVALPSRLAVGAYMMLIMIIGGRILPSFTGNWLKKRGVAHLPSPYGRFDTAALLVALVALLAWTMSPDHALTGVACLAAAGLHGIRLLRWRGWTTAPESLVLILHLAYGFVVLSFAALAAAAFGQLEPVAALHVATAGSIGAMTLAVMTRATRGHTGLELRASGLTRLSYAAVLVAGAIRPLTAVLPEVRVEIIELAGAAWILAFTLYVVEYGPVLLRKRKDLLAPRGSL
ncbi:NnrS family protein [Devosia oryziradicis]|uniref:NnrS family protein n=1 Tax=Devosia oryziradicis TaxID=2801335 RepID=A0ABX7BYV6_9HYPH|nr:NnrS family protein [Devosia oryziradicis]QQR36209.1 NnrS family protein [Devosia oryziradicis]